MQIPMKIEICPKCWSWKTLQRVTNLKKRCHKELPVARGVAYLCWCLLLYVGHGGCSLCSFHLKHLRVQFCLNYYLILPIFMVEKNRCWEKHGITTSNMFQKRILWFSMTLVLMHACGRLDETWAQSIFCIVLLSFVSKTFNKTKGMTMLIHNRMYWSNKK